jgi:hypothetical protein
MPYCYRFALTQKEIKEGKLLPLILEFNKLSRSLKKREGTVLLTGFDFEAELRAYRRQYFYVETLSEPEPAIQRFLKRHDAVACNLLYPADTRIIAGRIR